MDNNGNQPKFVLIDPKLDKMKKHDGLELSDDGYCIKGVGSYGYYSV